MGDLYEVFAGRHDVPEFRNVTAWHLKDGIWFLNCLDGTEIALPLIHHPVVEIRPQQETP